MAELNINSFLQKSEELKTLFELGQKVIPFLEELLIFTKDVYPSIEEINNSIEENLKKMPNASKQLSKVTEANELATTQIMNMIDNILEESDKVQSILKNIKESESLNQNEKNNLFNSSHSTIENIKNEANSIMIALQVQDITAQQIAAVNHLLDTIQNKFIGIINKFNSNDLSSQEHLEVLSEITNKNNLDRHLAFDPNAIDSMTDNGKRQEIVDDFIQSHENTSSSDTPSQDDIDALFNSSQDSSEEISRKDESSEPVAQDDIDALFSD